MGRREEWDVGGWVSREDWENGEMRWGGAAGNLGTYRAGDWVERPERPATAERVDMGDRGGRG